MKHHPPEGAVRRARRLRNNLTDAERKLWRLLREHFHDYHFRRQVPIRHFIADFASHRAKLIIEVDGDNTQLKRTRLVRRLSKVRGIA